MFFTLKNFQLKKYIILYFKLFIKISPNYLNFLIGMVPTRANLC